MGIIGKIGKKLIDPALNKAMERFTSKPEEGESRLGRLGKDVLRSAFPEVYAIATAGKKKGKKLDKKSAIAESVSDLSGEIAETNTILTASIETQTQQNIILEEILKALKEGKGAGGGPGIDMPDIPTSGKGKGGKPGAATKGKTPKGKPTVARDPKTGKFTKLKPTIGGRIASGAGKVAGGLVKGAPLIGGLVSGGLEYSESGKLGRAAAVGGGAIAGAAAGAALGTALFPGLGTLAGGIVGLGFSVLGGLAGEELGRTLYDKASGDKNKQDFEFETVSYNAENIMFKSNTMSIKTREFTIKGDIAGLIGAISSGGSGNDAAARQQALAGPGGVGERLGGKKNVVEGEPIIGVPRMARITSKSGKSTSVGEPYKEAFQGFLDDLEATGYKIKSLGGQSNRPNTSNPSVYSYHALGAAIDINPNENPYNSTQSDMPSQTASIAAAHGLGWGMNWSSVKDPMHFSAAGKEGGKFNIPQVPIKAYAKGTNYVPTTGPAVVGEKGSELVVGKNGVSVTPDQATVVNLNQGDKVIPAEHGSKFGKTKILGQRPNAGVYSRPTFKSDIDVAEGFSSKQQKEIGAQKVIIDTNWKADPENNNLSRVAIEGTAGSTDVSQGDLNKWYEKMGLKKKLVDQQYEGERFQATRQDFDETNVQKALTSGQKIDRPATMTQREFSNRIKDFGLPAMASGAISVDEYKKHVREADQPQYITDAQNTANQWIENEKKRDAPKVRPLELPSDYNYSSTKMLQSQFGSAN